VSGNQERSWDDLFRMCMRASRFRFRWVALAVAGLMVAGACGGDDDGTTGDTPEARGEQLVEDNGCVSCHGVKGVGGVGPAWVGLYGSERNLESGDTVVADGPYLARSITEPGAEVVQGYTVVMPENGLSTSEVDDVVAYIESLS